WEPDCPDRRSPGLREDGASFGRSDPPSMLKLGGFREFVHVYVRVCQVRRWTWSGCREGLTLRAVTSWLMECRHISSQHCLSGSNRELRDRQGQLAVGS